MHSIHVIKNKGCEINSCLSQLLSSYIKKLLSNCKETNLLFQNIALNKEDFDYITFLQELSKEQNFEVTYVGVDERDVNGKFQCLLQLSTLPVAVCYGTGNTFNDAQANASLNALEYLRLMTKP